MRSNGGTTLSRLLNGCVSVGRRVANRGRTRGGVVRFCGRAAVWQHPIILAGRSHYCDIKWQLRVFSHRFPENVGRDPKGRETTRAENSSIIALPTSRPARPRPRYAIVFDPIQGSSMNSRILQPRHLLLTILASNGEPSLDITQSSYSSTIA